LFQNITFLFQNAVCVSEFCVLISECRFCFGSALSALCHHTNGLETLPKISIGGRTNVTDDRQLDDRRMHDGI